MRQLQPEVRLRGGTMVTGRCLASDVKPPYGAWAEILEAIHALNLVPPREWTELPRLLPALGSAPTAPSSAVPCATPKFRLRRNWVSARIELPTRTTSEADVGSSDMRRMRIPDEMSSRRRSIPCSPDCRRCWLPRKIIELDMRILEPVTDHVWITVT